jgi:PAS domain-containing protein
VQPVTELTFAIGEVAAMLGISPHTIRAWERRHAVLCPTRTPSGQRRYSADDIEVLRQIKHERRVHGYSMRVATMTAQGLVVPEAREPSAAGESPPVGAEAVPDLLRLVPDLVSDVVVVVDASGRLLHANIAFVRFTEMLLGQLRGFAFADLVDPFDRAKAVQMYQAPLRQRRGWELNLRVRRRRTSFSFDCWPVQANDRPALVLVGRDLDAARRSPEAADAWNEARPAVSGGPGELAALLQGVADPVRTLRLLRRWLDATPAGVALARADAQLTVLAGNAVFRRWTSPRETPFEGRPWRRLAPERDAARIVAAAEEAVRSGQARHVSGTRPTARDGSEPAVEAVWDVDVRPVTDAGGAVEHVLLVIQDVTAEIGAVGRLGALAASTESFRRARDAGQLLQAAARHARALLPNAGSLVAAVRPRGPTGVGLVDATGVWSPGAQGSDHDVRMALVRDAVETHATIEVERSWGAEEVETLRIVPLPRPGPAPAEARPVFGALAFSRSGPASFSADDRLLIDEFAGRVGMALGRAELLSPARQSASGVAVEAWTARWAPAPGPSVSSNH